MANFVKDSSWIAQQFVASRPCRCPEKPVQLEFVDGLVMKMLCTYKLGIHDLFMLHLNCIVVRPQCLVESIECVPRMTPISTAV